MVYYFLFSVTAFFYFLFITCLCKYFFFNSTFFICFFFTINCKALCISNVWMVVLYINKVYKSYIPNAHFAVHDGRLLEATQQVLETDVTLSIPADVPVIVRHKLMEQIRHECLQAGFLHLVESLQHLPTFTLLDVTWLSTGNCTRIILSVLHYKKSPLTDM